MNLVSGVEVEEGASGGKPTNKVMNYFSTCMRGKPFGVTSLKQKYQIKNNQGEIIETQKKKKKFVLR